MMAFFGFCNLYALRSNLSVAIVAMTNNQSITIDGEEHYVISSNYYIDSIIMIIFLSKIYYLYANLYYN